MHVDYAELEQRKCLLVAGSYSNVMIMLVIETTSTHIVGLLRNLFASYGVPCELKSDNGPQFVSQEFKRFLDRNGVKHIRTPLYRA